jgi:hypothetical protein
VFNTVNSGSHLVNDIQNAKKINLYFVIILDDVYYMMYFKKKKGPKWCENSARLYFTAVCLALVSSTRHSEIETNEKFSIQFTLCSKKDVMYFNILSVFDNMSLKNESCRLMFSYYLLI